MGYEFCEHRRQKKRGLFIFSAIVTTFIPAWCHIDSILLFNWKRQCFSLPATYWPIVLPPFFLQYMNGDLSFWTCAQSQLLYVAIKICSNQNLCFCKHVTIHEPRADHGSSASFPAFAMDSNHVIFLFWQPIADFDAEIYHVSESPVLNEGIPFSFTKN